MATPASPALPGERLRAAAARPAARHTGRLAPKTVRRPLDDDSYRRLAA